MAKKVKSFNVTAKLNITCNIDIKAESLEDAIEQARTLGETDFVDILGDFIDGNMYVIGVYDNDD